MRYMIANMLLVLLPPTRFFAVKRTLLRWLGVSIGPSTRICGGVAFYGAGRVVIGRETWVGIDCRFYTSLGYIIEIGDSCDVAPELTFINGTHSIGGAERRAGANKADNIRIGSGTWVGARALVLGGADVGDSSVIGANSMLLPTIYPSSSLILGSPAKAAPLSPVQ